MQINPRRRLALLSLDAHIANRHQGCWGECELQPCVSDRQLLKPSDDATMVLSRVNDAIKERPHA